MKMIPLDDRVIVLPFEQESQTASGIIIPDTAKGAPVRGTVVAVGADMTELVQVDDTLVYGEFRGDPLNVEGVKYMILDRSDILVKLEE